MQRIRNLHSGKSKFLFGFTLLSFISVICAAFDLGVSDNFDFARREILLRRIGHELLLQSGDSTSRVLPVKKITENEYQISFENELTFQTEFLVKTTRRFLAKDSLAFDYVVTVLNCGNSSVAYGYAVSQNKKEDIVACLGRRQPKGCYIINVTFKPTRIRAIKNGYFIGSLSFLAFAGFILLRSVKPSRVLPADQHGSMHTLGSVLFDAKNRKLIINGKTTDLTTTETRILLVFALAPNETIERSRLQKEIWEDEGVIVGRSLDMFISKLRKKLEFDTNVNIVVIRSKGYKLKISC